MLPRELWGEVCDALDARDVATLACCDGARRAAADGPSTWRRLFDRDWGPTLAKTQSLSLAWTPREPGWAPPLGYKAFYSAFACTWVERAVVGANVEGSRVLVGIHGAVYDITAFAPQHPGSLDTVLDFAGTDATTFFEDVGHSSVARKIMRPTVWKSNLQHDFNVRVCDSFDASPSAVLRELDESNRFV